MATREERLAWLMTKRGMTITKAIAIMDMADRASITPPVDRVRKLTASQERLASQILGDRQGMIVRVSDAGDFEDLIPTERYEGKTVFARRAKVDQLDQVTIWRRE